MNSPKGKGILALVRGGAFAHAGEAEAIEMMLGPMPKDEDRNVLDAGCGLGGTADYVQKHGWGYVTGFDIDAKSIKKARRAFPDCTFAVADVCEVDGLWRKEFDLIYCFNTMYAFPRQKKALRALAKTARKGARLLISDYTDPGNRYEGSAFEERKDAGSWKPLRSETFEKVDDTWWLDSYTDITEDYLRWYEDLVRRIEEHRDEVVAQYEEEAYEFVHTFYTGLRDAIRDGVLGGGIFSLSRL